MPSFMLASYTTGMLSRMCESRRKKLLQCLLCKKERRKEVLFFLNVTRVTVKKD